MVGAGALALARRSRTSTAPRWSSARWRSATVLHLVVLAVEYGGRHASATRGASRRTWSPTAATPGCSGRRPSGSVCSPSGAAFLSWNGGLLAAAAVAGLLVQVVLLAYESVFVRAGQDVPLS